jgi:protoporphyrinogen oxidase
LVDYLLANAFTRNALLVEIKTPMMPLLGSLYRGDIHNVSADLSGTVQQASNYKHQLLQNSRALSGDSSQEFHAFNPPSLIIAGSTQELDSRAKTKAFELFRGGLRDIQVITFAELYKKLKTLVELLDGGPTGLQPKPIE